MRDIKFRYWNGYKMFEVKRIVFSNVDNDRLYQLEGYYKDSFVPKKSQIGGLSTSDTYLIMQYTGLKDKNGVEIYEGDICNQLLLRKFGEEENPRYVGEVTFQPSSGYRVGSEGIWPNDIEVIGNIYENQDLLEDKK